MTFLGMNIYCLDREQRSLLLDGFRVWAAETREQGLSDFFICRRFDARGPHVFALMRGKPELQEFLEKRVRDFIGALSPSSLRPEELRRRHRQCRGRALCEVDRGPDFVENHTYSFFQQPADEYPLALAKQASDPESFLQSLDSLTMWSLERVQSGTGNTAAVRWIAAVEQSLVRHQIQSWEFWGHYAKKLLPILEQRPARLDEVHLWLQNAVSENNRRLLTPAWEQEQQADPAQKIKAADAVVAAIFGPDRSKAAEKFDILYEVSDLLMHQLWQPANSQIILVLYALQRSLPAAISSAAPVSSDVASAQTAG